MKGIIIYLSFAVECHPEVLGVAGDGKDVESLVEASVWRDRAALFGLETCHLNKSTNTYETQDTNHYFTTQQ